MRCTRPPAVLSFFQLARSAGSWSWLCGRRVSLALCRARLLLMRVSALGSSVAAVVWLVAAVLASGLSWLQLAGVGSFALRVAKPNNTRHNQALHPTARSVVVFPAFRLCS